jgi:hypothetical protein
MMIAWACFNAGPRYDSESDLASAVSEVADRLKEPDGSVTAVHRSDVEKALESVSDGNAWVTDMSESESGVWYNIGGVHDPFSACLKVTYDKERGDGHADLVEITVEGGSCWRNRRGP